VGQARVERDAVERQRLLDQVCQELLSRASAQGFTLVDIVQALEQRRTR
jgi:hypothetical protein